MSDKFIPNGDDAKLCCHCWYARTRRDICGIYCTKGFVKDGKCDMYESYSQHKKSAKSKPNCGAKMDGVKEAEDGDR